MEVGLHEESARFSGPVSLSSCVEATGSPTYGAVSCRVSEQETGPGGMGGHTRAVDRQKPGAVATPPRLSDHK